MKKKGKNSLEKKVKEMKKQRREYIHRKRRKRKRKKRQREKEQARKRRLKKRRFRECPLEESGKKAESTTPQPSCEICDTCDSRQMSTSSHLARCPRESKEDSLTERSEGEPYAKKAVKEEKPGKHKQEENVKEKRPEKGRGEKQRGREKKKKEERKGKKPSGKRNQKKCKKRYRGRRYRRQRYRRNKRIIQAAVLCIFMTVLYVFSSRKVVKELVIEAGDSVPELSAFLTGEEKDAHFTREIDRLDMNTVADYKIGITISGKEYTSILHVVDTKKPVVVTKKMRICKDYVLEPENFIEKMDDATKTVIEFVKEPDFAKLGTQKVTLKVTDEGGNMISVSAKLEILEDAAPPVIEGVKELTVAIGDSISYKKGVTVSDDLDEDVELKVDNSQVKLNTRGDYPVVYIAEDMAGNVTEEETVVHVRPASVETATEEMVNEKADEILGQITTEDMSRRDMAKAIFDWVHENVGWSDGAPKTNWIQGAYRGLIDRRGDCYVYASTSKCLLTRAGIENMDIGFSNSRRTHYWNLIDIGEGWYHFDTTRRADGRSFFYYKDAEIRAYSASHGGSHAYDPSQYPVIQ